MPIEVFDFRNDVKNVFISPAVRGRFLRMEPGEVGARHSHDVGEELFLILSGQCEFEIEGEYAVLGPGQLCATKVDEKHSVRVIGEEPLTMFLTVTPHIEPTHTFWNDEGEKHPPRYGGATAAERAAAPSPSASLEQVATGFALAVANLNVEVAANAASQPLLVAALIEQLTADPAAAKLAVDDIWAQLSTIYAPLRELGLLWNDLAQRVADLQP